MDREQLVTKVKNLKARERNAIKHFEIAETLKEEHVQKFIEIESEIAQLSTILMTKYSMDFEEVNSL